MEYRNLGETGLRISKLVLGTMTFGGVADKRASSKMFGLSMDRGINCFDCANVYNEGRAEEFLGNLIADLRHEVVVTSKAGFPTGSGINQCGASRHHLTRAIEESLVRLNTDYIDIYFIHRFDEKTPLRESIHTLEQLVLHGKIRYWGVSNFAAWQVMKALCISLQEGWTRVACLQPMYNLVKRQAEVELLPMSQSEGLGVLVYNPLGGGLLTGKYGVGKRPQSGRLLEDDHYRLRYGEPWMLEVADRLVTRAAEYGATPAGLAVAWAASHAAVTGAIIGARNAEQLEESLAAAEIDMTEELREEISALSPTPPPATDRLEEQKAV